MASLYEISNDILRIFNNVESNEGEITEEEYNELVIKQEELREKLDSYVKAIKTWEVEEKALKEEKKKFNDRQNIFKNRIDRLKKAALNAVITFGERGKNNHFVELTNYRLFTKESKSVEVDENRINILIAELERYIRELVSNGVLYTGEDVDLQGILESINANVIAEQGENFMPYTLSDLTTLKLSISSSATIYELFRNHKEVLCEYANHPNTVYIDNITPKDDWKVICNIADNNEISYPTVAKVLTNQNLQIK